ncbi:MAG: TolC family protein, partial [Planctomycetia bacterium]
MSNAFCVEMVRLPEVEVETAPTPNFLLSEKLKAIQNVVPVSPQAGPKVTIEQLQQMALATNPTLIQAAAHIRALRGTQVQAGLCPNPNIGWVAEEMGNGGQAGRQGVGFSQEIVTGNKLGLSRATASRAVWAAEAQFRAQQLRVENDVRISAIAILASQERIQILEKLVKISEDDAKITEELFKAKEVNQSEVLMAFIEANRTSLTLHTARRNYLASWQRLAGILGRPDMQQVPIEGDLKKNIPALAWEASLTRLLIESPLLEEANAKIAQARCEWQRQCAERKSNLEIGAAVAYNDDSEYTEATLEVMVPLKIYDRNQGNIMRARAELMMAHQERDRLGLVLHNQLAQAFREYSVAQTE